MWCTNCISRLGTEVKRNHKRMLRVGTHSKVILLAAISRLFAQSPALSPDRPWHSPEERQVISDAQRLHYQSLRIEPDRAYSLAELIDLAEAHNPETRVVWESARAQAAALVRENLAFAAEAVRLQRLSAEADLRSHSAAVRRFGRRRNTFRFASSGHVQVLRP